MLRRLSVRVGGASLQSQKQSCTAFHFSAVRLDASSDEPINTSKPRGRPRKTATPPEVSPSPASIAAATVAEALAPAKRRGRPLKVAQLIDEDDYRVPSQAEQEAEAERLADRLAEITAKKPRKPRTVKKTPGLASVSEPVSGSSSSPVATPLAASEAAVAAGDLWAWVPPKERREQFADSIRPIARLSVVKNTLLSADEVVEYLSSSGGENVVSIDVSGQLFNLKKLVIASGTTPRLLRQWAESIVENMKDRGLHKLQGVRNGVEGERTDDWQLVDCETFLVHLMTPKARRHYDLDGHWSGPRPCLPVTGSEAEYDAAFERLLDRYPVPDEDEDDPISMTIRPLADDEEIPTYVPHGGSGKTGGPSRVRVF